MARNIKSQGSIRRDALRQMLSRLRDETYVKVRELRHDQEHEAEPPPADDLEAARATSDVETHATLIERAEDRLKFIDEALERVERDTYGTCADCGEDIGIERLTAIPFALRCVDCQEKQNHAASRWGEGRMISPYEHQWNLPEEMREPREYRIEAIGTRTSPAYEESPPQKTARAKKPVGATSRRPRTKRGRKTGK